MVNVAQIRDELIKYLAHQQTLDDFNDWLLANTWDVPPNDPSGVRRVFGLIELAVAEHSAGHLSTDSLHQQLISLLGNYEVQFRVAGSTPQISTTSSASTPHLEFEAEAA